jgi:putative chitinase
MTKDSVIPALQWELILTQCGVSSDVASTWSNIFSEAIRETTFSKGLTELPDFLGQILHESMMLTRLEENLNYTRPERLMQIWPRRFPTLEVARAFIRKPKALANKVYGERLGNVNGDGWTYRGSGLIMCTGLANFQAVEEATGMPVCSEPELLRQPEGALAVAIAWWEDKVPDSAMGNRVKIRRAVNGGTIGLEETTELSNKAQEALDGYI